MSRRLSSLEKKLMLALNLENVRQLDHLLAQLISQDAALHRQPLQPGGHHGAIPSSRRKSGGQFPRKRPKMHS
jgi:hypothetical protein